MVFSFLLCMVIAAGCLLSARILFHYFQLESYQHPGYFHTIRRNSLKAFLPGLCMTALTTVLLNMILLFDQLKDKKIVFCLLCVICAAVYIVCGWMTGKKCEEKNTKKALVMTPRMKRLYVVSFILATLIAFLLNQISGRLRLFSFFAIEPLMLFPLLLPLWVALFGLLAWPIEKAISEMYFRDAQRILRERNDLIRIGITGSWGKTSVKFILGTILEEKYHTLVTPASFNTPMGVTKVIRTRIEPGHRIFVAEMGARHVGDIREMCRLVHPQIGILTSVGPQHLDTFKTLERVVRTKYELIDALPQDGKAFFADDGDICLELYKKTGIEKHLTGLEQDRDEVWAEDICYSSEGSSFVLCHGTDRTLCRTELLGELNIRNILLCASVALSLGMSMAQIARGIGKIQPVEHRLQLIRHPGGLNVIDDAFNSNIRGAKQAFQVLKQFPARRIIVTPGMVELGDKEYEMNREFGASMSGCCDIAVLVGKKRSEAIADGLKNQGFPEQAIKIVSSLDEATKLLREISGPGDTVLFENDLPDNYSET